jgi:hypothetical protein
MFPPSGDAKMLRRFFLGLWVLVSVFVVFAAREASCGEETDQVRQARQQAIQAELARIEAEIKAHGGSIARWGESLKEFREDVQRIISTEKWPWPAKEKFVFQGKEAQLVLCDTLDDLPEGKRPLESIVAFDRALRAKGIDLIFVPLPDKLAVYPDYLSDKAPADRMVSVAIKDLLKKLLEQDVEVVDLYTVFRDYRLQHPDRPLHYDTDSHWRNRGAQLAGEKIAERLKRYDFVQKALAEEPRYKTREEFRPDKPDQLLCVLEAKSGAYYRDVSSSPIVLHGDSNAMYNMSKQIAHLPAQVARHINMPLAFVPASLGETPVKHRNQPPGRKVVIWAPIARFLHGSDMLVIR